MMSGAAPAGRWLTTACRSGAWTFERQTANPKRAARAAKPVALVACALVAIGISCSPVAHAQTQSSSEAQPPDIAAQRRSGFVIGLHAGLGLGQANGNPAAIAQREDPAYTTDTGSAFAYQGAPFIGGALTDWFTIGVGGALSWIGRNGLSSPAYVALFHIEAYPLFTRGGLWRDAGLFADFGAGSTYIYASDGSEKASAAVASALGLGTFWEGLRWGHLAAGPYAGYHRNWGEHFSRDNFTLGLRVAVYGGP
jgi:hypothetical protein